MKINTVRRILLATGLLSASLFLFNVQGQAALTVDQIAKIQSIVKTDSPEDLKEFAKTLSAADKAELANVAADATASLATKQPGDAGNFAAAIADIAKEPAVMAAAPATCGEVALKTQSIVKNDSVAAANPSAVTSVNTSTSTIAENSGVSTTVTGGLTAALNTVGPVVLTTGTGTYHDGAWAGVVAPVTQYVTTIYPTEGNTGILSTPTVISGNTTQTNQGSTGASASG